MKHIFLFCVFAAFTALPHIAAAQVKEGEVRIKSESITRYDVLEAAKNYMSCAAVYDLTKESGAGDFFRSEVRDLFMMDNAQTEEETAAWVAGADDYYTDYWRAMLDSEEFESARKIERHRRECMNIEKLRANKNAITKN